MTMAEAKQLAVQSRITDEDQQELALKFFHDTKKIICLSKFVMQLTPAWGVTWVCHQ